MEVGLTTFIDSRIEASKRTPIPHTRTTQQLKAVLLDALLPHLVLVVVEHTHTENLPDHVIDVCVCIVDSNAEQNAEATTYGADLVAVDRDAGAGDTLEHCAHVQTMTRFKGRKPLALSRNKISSLEPLPVMSHSHRSPPIFCHPAVLIALTALALKAFSKICLPSLPSSPEATLPYHEILHPDHRQLHTGGCPVYRRSL
ncbi:hypothetical protein BC936DRAFT_137641 [Jimgerdemannia flammicorona]|uniref:Uncharacterized protein n=1 Tax=Jimgerdemannia flammicorona TaxID=994334 RepID=A0A433DIY2_9FUNG|nr:hypothetical protein BC936DRAFT_137641 [Jimgerdemannia flammicorona]